MRSSAISEWQKQAVQILSVRDQCMPTEPGSRLVLLQFYVLLCKTGERETKRGLKGHEGMEERKRGEAPSSDDIDEQFPPPLAGEGTCRGGKVSLGKKVK